jgi:hypothetical protein
LISGKEARNLSSLVQKTLNTPLAKRSFLSGWDGLGLADKAASLMSVVMNLPFMAMCLKCSK